MNKLSKTLLITFLGLFSINPSYAFDVFSLESDTTNNVLKVYGVDLITKEKTFLTEKNLETTFKTISESDKFLINYVMNTMCPEIDNRKIFEN